MRARVGRYEVLFLTDVAGSFPLPVEQLFPSVAEDEWPRYRRLYPSAFAGPNGWRARVGCTLIRGAGRTILVDTGLGPADLAFARFLGMGGGLPDRLGDADVDVNEVDTVLLTHLHADHVGWNLQRSDGRLRPTFPSARYLVHDADWQLARQASATAAEGTEYVAENVLLLAELRLLDTFAGDREVADGIVAFETPGHTPGHVSVRIDSEGRGLLLLGDAVAHPLQLTAPQHQYLFDIDPHRARQTRHSLCQQIEEGGELVSACHFPAPGVGQVTMRDGSAVWEPTRDTTADLSLPR